MAIVQISRIQHRKGLQQDLPQLASAELGWSVDTRQLYIGNGTIAEGAPVEGITEILTQYSDILNIGNQYIFKGAQTGYTSQTGTTALTPIQRSLQQKLDDTVSVRDFGALGDGITDDTAAIQRAIDQIYFGGFSLGQPRLRRVINFPPGVYVLSDSIKLPSYTYLAGAGTGRTILRITGSSKPLLQLKDSSGQVDSSYGTLQANAAQYINVRDMTLQHQGTYNILQLDTCNDIDFHRVEFIGGQTSVLSQTDTSRSKQNAVYAVPTSNSSNLSQAVANLRFIDCSFSQCTQGFVLNAINVKIIGCNFSGMNRAVWVDTTYNLGLTYNIKIANSTFDNIGRSALYVYAADAITITNIISVGNYYGEVGTLLLGAGNANTPVINFVGGSGNYSMGDSFTRTDADAGVYPRVGHATGSLNASLGARDGLQTGMIRRGTGRQVSLSASQINANTAIVLSGISGGATINYMLQRPGASAYRTGKIEVVYTGTHVQYTDEYTEYPNATTFTYPGPTGITFTASSLGSSQAGIYYTSDSSGTATLTYSITNFQI